MKSLSRIFIGVSILLSSVVLGSSLASCEKPKSGYTVNFHAGENHKINNQDIYVMSKQTSIDVEPSPDPDSSGATSFAGWFENKECTGSRIDFPYELKTDKDFYAKYNVKSGVYTISFNAQGGKEVPTYQIKIGESIKTSPFTSKDEYSFVGWYDNQECTGDPLSFPFTPGPNDDGKTFYAKWEHIEKYKLIMHTNGGTKPSGTILKEGETDVYETDKSYKIIQTAPSSTKGNASLEGWYFEKTYTNLVNFPFDIAKKGANTDIYAKWSEKQGYTVTLKDGNDIIGTITNCSCIAYMPTHTKEHKDLIGWKDKNGQSITYPYYVNEDTTLTAVWQDKSKYTVTLYDVDKTTSIGIKQEEVNTVLTGPYAYNGSQKDYSLFDGWYTNSECTEPLKYPKTITNDLSLYAKVHRVSANVNIYNPSSNSVIYSYGNITNIGTFPTLIHPTRPNDFSVKKIYYYRIPSDVSTRVDISTPLVIGDISETAFVNNELKLYVEWQQNKFNIEIIYEEGNKTTLLSQNANITYKELPQITIPDKKISKWQKLNAKGEPAGDPIDASSTESLNLDKDITIKAVWEVTHRDLKVYRDGKTDPEVLNHCVVKDFKLSDVPLGSKLNHTLKGYTVGTDTTVKTITDTIDIDKDDMYITEVWVRSAAKLTIKYNDDIVTGINDKIYESHALTFNTSTLPLETFPGYKITGFKNGETTYSLNQEVTISDDTTLNAIWGQSAFTVTFNYNYPEYEGKKPEGPQNHIIENCTTITKDMVPSVAYPDNKFLFQYWYTTDSSIPVDPIGKVLDKDITYTAYWKAQEEAKFNVTFNVGSYQGLAKFKDGTRVKTYENQVVPMSFDGCPIATCPGYSFLGWFTNETESKEITYPITTSQTVYAHWAPLKGYVTLTLKLDSGGTFGTTGSSSTLIGIKANEETWGDVVNDIPSVTYDDAFKVGSWKYKDDTEIKLTDMFASHTFIYASKTEDDKDPTKSIEGFYNDSWPTFCKVAENKIGNYSNGIEALKAIYDTGTSKVYEAESFTYIDGKTYEKVPDSFVGLMRPIKFEGITYNVRIVGQHQDYATDSTSGTKFPLTFEFEKSICTSLYFPNGTDVPLWESSITRAEMYNTGTIYKNIQESITFNDHIKKTFKYTEQCNQYGSSWTGVWTEDYLFIASDYELGCRKQGSYGTYFRYDYYTKFIGDHKNDDQWNTGKFDARKKIYKDLDSACYWTRSINSKDGDIFRMRYIKDESSQGSYGFLYASEACYYRPVVPLFCIGTAYE